VLRWPGDGRSSRAKGGPWEDRPRHPRPLGAPGEAAARAADGALLFAAGAEAAKSGKLLYAKRIGSSTTEAGATAIAAGPKGVTALAGYQRQGTYYPMVAKYTSAGKRVWLRRYTAAVEGWADDVAFDRSGNVYVAATVWSGTSGRRRCTTAARTAPTRP